MRSTVPHAGFCRPDSMWDSHDGSMSASSATVCCSRTFPRVLSVSRPGSVARTRALSRGVRSSATLIPHNHAERGSVEGATAVVLRPGSRTAKSLKHGVRCTVAEQSRSLFDDRKAEVSS